MTADNLDIVRPLWATLERDPGAPWPPPRAELDRRPRLELVDERIELRNPPEFPVADEYHGHERLRRGLRRSGKSSARCITSWWLREAEDGGTVVSVQRTQGRMRHTELKVDLEWATIWTIRDGKALRAHGYMARAEALEAAGLAR